MSCRQSCVPNKINIKFYAAEKPSNMEQFLSPILMNLCQKGINCERYIVFSRTYDDTLEFFKLHSCPVLY